VISENAFITPKVYKNIKQNKIHIVLLSNKKYDQKLYWLVNQKILVQAIHKKYYKLCSKLVFRIQLKAIACISIYVHISIAYYILLYVYNMYDMYF